MRLEVVFHRGQQPGRFITGRLDYPARSEEHTSELQSHHDLVCRLLLDKKNPSRLCSACTHRLPLCLSPRSRREPTSHPPPIALRTPDPLLRCQRAYATAPRSYLTSVSTTRAVTPRVWRDHRTRARHPHRTRARLR